MAPSSETNPRPPEDFARMLAAPEPLLLVGGQAVNLWALYYEDRVRDLAPFVSRDTDVLGDRATLELLGKLAGARPQYFPLKPPSNEVGVVIAHDAEGEPLLIEVLRYVRGASNEEIRETTYRFALGEPAVQVKAPGPIALLQAKVANLAEIKQTGRQDGRHVVILARIMPAYLEDLCTSATAGRMDERKLLKLLEKLLAIITSPTGRKTWSDLRLDPWALFDGLRPDALPRLQSFLSQRLPRALPRG
ncbi:MAG: hypothetical protein KF897_17660 [Opitutaceae bacterium]|nr:hypothetical protein [Opitutaceae bacterium]